MKFDDIKIGLTAALTVEITKRDVKQFYQLTGDTNSIHQGKQGVVYGALTAAFISTLIGRYLPGDGAVIVRSHITFIQPVRVGDIITVVGAVVGMHTKDSTIKIFVDVHNQVNTLVISGVYLVKVP
jgi:3-hydroxybutyryl-CoA dehydratase